MTSLYKGLALALAAVALLLLLTSAVYVQDTTEYVVVTRLGDPIRTSLEPGLRLRAPLGIERIDRIPNRLHLLLPSDTEYLTSDPKNLTVSSFLLWRVSDPLRYLQSVATREGAEARLVYVLSSELGTSLGHMKFSELINAEEHPDGLEQLSTELLQRCRAIAEQEYGIEVVDVGIRRLGFPERNRVSVFERMRAERKRIAVKHRSEGEEEATKIRSEARLDSERILSEALRDAAATRGEAEAEAARIYAAAIRQDPQFFEFLRTLEAYEAIIDEDTTLVLPADAELLDLLLEGPEGYR